MSDSKRSSDEETVINLDLIQEQTLKALAIAGKAQGDIDDEIDPVFSAVFAKQFLDKRYNNKPAKRGTLDGNYLVRDLTFDLKTNQFTLDLIFAPRIVSIADEKIRVVIEDGEIVDA